MMHWFAWFNIHWVYYLILAAVLIAGLYVVLLGAPGLWVMVLGTIIYAMVTHFEHAGFKTIFALLLLAGAAELLEFLITGAGAKSVGASRWGLWGAIIGSIVGAIFLTAIVPIPILGTLFGVCLGTFVGALIGELLGGREVGSSLKIGVGAATGRLLGLMSKLFFGAIMLLIVLIAALPSISHAKATAPIPQTQPATVPSQSLTAR